MIGMTFLIAAGKVKESDETLGIIQNLSLQQAEYVASWLALATDEPVHIRHISLGEAAVDILLNGAADVQLQSTATK